MKIATDFDHLIKLCNFERKRITARWQIWQVSNRGPDYMGI